MIYRHLQHILILLTLVFTFASCKKGEDEKPMPRADYGVLDLSGWEFETDGYVKLDGEWEFYWNRLLTPTDLNYGSYPMKTGTIQVPSVWNRQTIGETSIEEKGFATYRLYIQFNNRNNLYSLKTGNIETAHKMWINNQLIVQNGIVAENKENATPKVKPSHIYFQTDSSIVEIVLQVSNFNNSKGGITDSIYFGLPDQITQIIHFFRAYFFFLLGVFFIMTAYHLGLYILARDDISPLLFGLVCFLTAVNLLSMSEINITHFIPSLSWEFIIKINFITSIFRLSVFVLYIQQIFQEEIKSLFAKSLLALSVVLSLFVVFTGPNIFTYLTIPFQISGTVIVVYLLIGMIRAAMRKKQAAIYSIIGTVILLITIVNDVLLSNYFINSIYLIPAGIFIFIFFQSFILSIRFSQSFISAQKMSKSLVTLDKIKNRLLESAPHQLFIPLRILVENLNAEKGCFIISHNYQWVVAAKASVFKEDGESVPFLELSAPDPSTGKILVPRIIIHQVINTKQKINLADAYFDGRYVVDDYVMKNHVRSVLCVPLMIHNTLKGIIYLENNSDVGAFSENEEHILDLLSSQLSTLIENAQIYQELENLNKNLEQKVLERTKEIQEKNKILSQQTEKIEAQNKMLLEKQQTLEDTLDIAEEQKNELNRKNKNITDSIIYAERIQQSIFPPKEKVDAILKHSFILFMPKDILSGDFYWLEYVNPNNESEDVFENLPYNEQGELTDGTLLLAAVDCTGHGVPGALLSIVGNNLLNYAVKERHLTQPSEILNVLEEGFVSKVRSKDTIVQDGMDMGLISYNFETRILQYAGAQNPMYHVRGEELTVINGDKVTIGGVKRKKDIDATKFTNNEIQIEKGDLVYIFTDGYIDQFGGPKHRKFMFSTFKKLLMTISDKPLKQQKEILIREFEEWRGDFVQIDDILIIGIQF